MKSYSLIKQLIEHVEAFEGQADATSIDLDHFMAWMLANYNQRKSVESVKDVEGKNFELFAAMERYTSYYLKEVFKDLPLTTIWDFSFVAILDAQGPTSMTDLIKKAKLEKPSGMEVIKRLIKKDFVERIPNTEDKRSKLLRNTEVGKQVLYTTYPKVVELSRTISGSLDTREKLILLSLLKKLDSFHSHRLGFTKAI